MINKMFNTYTPIIWRKTPAGYVAGAIGNTASKPEYYACIALLIN
jgi:hypothetical protein